MSEPTPTPASPQSLPEPQSLPQPQSLPRQGEQSQTGESLPAGMPTDVPRMLGMAQQLIAAGAPEAIQGAAELSHRAIQMLKQQPLDDADLWNRQLAAAWIIHGHALREIPAQGARKAALKAYDEALAALAKVPNIVNDEERNDRANLWTNRGRTFLEEGTPDALKEAVRCFEQAVELRHELPVEENPNYRWGLSASLMNRGDALTRLGEASGFKEAIASYDEAIEHLMRLPYDEHAGTRSRLAIAFMNRGITWQSHGTPEAASKAVDTFEEGISLLQAPTEAKEDEQAGILSCLLMNHGNSLMFCEPPDALRGLESARKALEMVAGAEREEPMAAEVGIKARHLTCRLLAYLLDHPPVGKPLTEDWVTEATDAADDGMELTRHWNLKGVPHFQPLAGDLFRFGSRIYQVSQPHFLAEFLLDSIDPERSPGAPARDPYMFHIAGESLWNAVVEIEKAVPRAKDPEQREALLEVLAELQQAEVRLSALREQHLAPEGDADKDKAKEPESMLV